MMAKDKDKDKKKKNKAKVKGKVKLSSLTVEEKPAFPVFMDAEWYKAKFVDAEVKEGKYGEYAILKFEILNGYMEDEETEAKGRNANMLVDCKVYPGSGMFNFIEKIAGETPDVEDDIDLTAYYGTKCEVHFENKEKKDGSGDVNSNINKVRLPKKKKKKGKK